MADWDLSPYDPAYGRPAEFGDLARSNGRWRNDRELVWITGAENLLAKAAAHISAGNLDRAEHLIERAAAMPYDAHQGGSPGVLGASLLVYGIVTDRFEESAEDDTDWLDISLVVHGGLGGLGQAELASVIHGFVLQENMFDLTPTEVGRIRDAVGDAPLEADLGDSPDLTTEERGDIIRSLVEAASALHQAYDERDRG